MHSNMAGPSRGKGIKRALEEIDFGVELEIDSTAPLDKILHHLLDRERFSKAYKLYLLLLVQRRKVLKDSRNLHFIVPGHPLKAFSEDWDGETNTSYFEPFLYKSTMPKIITQMKNVGKSDPVTDYMTVKANWKTDLKGIKVRFAPLNMSQKMKVEHLNEDVMQCPKYLIDVAAKLDSDPDPNFTSTYNWYYAGNGNLQLVCIGWIDYLLHSDFSSLYLTRLHKEDMSLEREHETSFDCENDQILETICSPLNIIALRTMNKIIILKIVDIDNHIYFDKMKQFESKTPFTSISFDKHHTNILYATTLNSDLTIVNIDRMTGRSVKLKRKSISNVDNWNSVMGAERGTYMHVEKKSITFYDKRSNGVINCWGGLMHIVDEVHCNDISAAKLCGDSPSLYFTTDHHLLLMDTRCCRSTKPRALQRWTHGLECVPTYISIGKADNNKELIVLSSQWLEDTCVVSNYADSVEKACDIPGVSMPFHPPHIMNTLNEARLKLLCSDTNNPIDGRLAASTSGLVVAEQGENFAILTHNSMGDIMLRTLYPDYMESFVEDDSVQKLHDWSQLYKVERKDFEVSSITNIANIWKKLERVPDSYDFGPKNKKPVIDESKIYDAFENEELIPELLDAWVNEGNNDNNATIDDSSFALNLHYDDSGEE